MKLLQFIDLHQMVVDIPWSDVTCGAACVIPPFLVRDVATKNFNTLKPETYEIKRFVCRPEFWSASDLLATAESFSYGAGQTTFRWRVHWRASGTPTGTSAMPPRSAIYWSVRCGLRNDIMGQTTLVLLRMRRLGSVGTLGP